MANRVPHGKAPIGAGRGKMDFKVLNRLMKQVFSDYPVHLTIVLICIVLSALIGVAPAAYIETITRYIEEGLTSGWAAILPKLTKALFTMAALYLVSLILTTIYTQLMAHVTQGFLHKTRVRMFSTMQRLPISYFDQTPRGDIMSRFTNDTDSLRQVVSQSLPNLLSCGLTVLGVLCMMVYYSLPLMLVVILGIVCMTLATKNIGGKSAKYFVRQQNSLGKAEGFIEEMMNGQKVVKVFCHEEAAKQDFDKLNDQLFRDAREANRFANIFMPIMGNIGNLLYVLTAFAGGLLITSNGLIPNLSIQNLVTFGTIAAPLSISAVASYLGMCKQFTANVSQVSQQMNAVAMAVAGAGRIFDLLDQKPESDEGTVTLTRCREENGTIVPCAERTGKCQHRACQNEEKQLLHQPLLRKECCFGTGENGISGTEGAEGIAILQKRTHRTCKRKLLAGQQAVHFLLDCIEVEFCKKFVLRCCCLIRFGIRCFDFLRSSRSENETQKKQRHAPSGFFTENHEPFPAERAAPAY